MLIITNDQRWQNFVSNCSISKVLHVQNLSHGPWRKPIETEGESHSIGTSRQVQVLRKQGKCIYRGNDAYDISLARPLCFPSRRSIDSRSSSSGRWSFTDSSSYLNLRDDFRCCPSFQLRFLRTIALLNQYVELSSIIVCSSARIVSLTFSKNKK